ncbi:MAG: glycosyltransferase family 2 protein [Candidatus Geothermincolia bacterium]
MVRKQGKVTSDNPGRQKHEQPPPRTDAGEPLVSVILPTYNRSSSLLASIESVLSQTYENIQLIIVDDGSTDSSEEVVLGLRDARVMYLHHDENMGVAYARNVGIGAAEGSYVAFQDSDDVWRPRKLEVQMRCFEKAPLDVGVVYSTVSSKSGDRLEFIPAPGRKKAEGYLYNELMSGNFIDMTSAVVRRECFDVTGMFDTRLHRLIDWEMWIRISRRFRFLFIDEVLSEAVIKDDGISRDNEALIDATRMLVDTHFADRRNDRATRGRGYYFLGKLLCSSNGYREGRKYLWKAFATWPLSGRYALHAFLALGGRNIYAWGTRLLSAVPR